MPTTPDNGGYMIAAYVVTAVVVLGYAAVLFWQASKVRGKR